MEKQTLVKEICPTTTQEWVKRGALLVDVREIEEVEQLAYDVPNIINMPLSVFEDRFNEIPKDKEVVVVCKSGGRSLRAAGFLVNHGYTNVVNMEHGMIRWATKGFPTKGDTSSVLANTQSTNCCDTITEKEKVKTNDSGNCDCSKNDCC
jgi:rhodanese-related sulfurtransferase